MGFKIKSIKAFICEHEDGVEGVIAQIINGYWVPFIASDDERIKYFRPIAEKIAKETKKKIKLIEFTNRQELEELS